MMDIEVKISFDVNSVFVQAGKLNRKFSNSIALDKTLNKIVAIGETEQTLSARDPQHWERIKNAVAFKSIFDPHNFDPESMYWATRMLTSKIHSELRGVNLFDNIICTLNIPKYEMASEASKEYFEMRLERWPKLRSLSVNGTIVLSKGWKYNFAKFMLDWSRYILLALLLILFARRPETLYNIFAALIQGPIFTITLLAFLALIALWGIEIAWMFSMQWLLPKHTLRRIFAMYQLQFVRENKLSISKMLASFILGKDNE